MHALPSSGRLITFAVLVPAFVASSNQLLFSLVGIHYGLRVLLYPWMAFTTAVLSWCAGRYLSPAWLRWMVFGWCLILLDCLTVATCMSGPLTDDFAFILVSAQISLIMLWSILAEIDWQWRLPVSAAAIAIVVLFARIFISKWTMQSWGLLLVLSAVIALLVCGGLRWLGFVLRNEKSEPRDVHFNAIQSNQFGIKHMLIWAAALAPVLLVARGIDVLILAGLNAPNIFHATLLSLSFATVNLVPIWTVLGSGLWFPRIAALFVIPIALSIGLRSYTTFVRSPIAQPLPRAPLVYLFTNMEEVWAIWLCSNAILLAALLLFLRADGYRLVRSPTKRDI